MKIFFIASLLSLTFLNILANDTNPEELGKVNWIRDLAEAQNQSIRFDKPILILFQEIPGCSTCKRYGNEVLSHPLLVEAIESLFIPLAIFNNRKGKDEKVLNYYREPSWNNPVVRVVGSDKRDILARLDGKYSPAGLASYMIQALKKCGKPIPGYLSLIEKELLAIENGVKKTTVSMYCFWTGEKEFGKLDGVVHTEAGYMDGREVVNIYYNPQNINLETIIEKGSNARCADRIYVEDEQEIAKIRKLIPTKSINKAGEFRLDREPKYYLSQTIYQYLPMSPLQAVKANSLIGQGKQPKAIFSPRQLKMLEHLGSDQAVQTAVHPEDWQQLFYTVQAKMEDY